MKLNIYYKKTVCKIEYQIISKFYIFLILFFIQQKMVIWEELLIQIKVKLNWVKFYKLKTKLNFCFVKN